MKAVSGASAMWEGRQERAAIRSPVSVRVYPELLELVAIGRSTIHGVTRGCPISLLNLIIMHRHHLLYSRQRTFGSRENMMKLPAGDGTKGQ